MSEYLDLVRWPIYPDQAGAAAERLAEERGSGMIVFTDDWDNPRLEPQDFDAIGDFVFMRVRVSGAGKATRLEMTTRFFHAWRFRDVKPWRLKPWRCIVRSTREEAVKAVHLAA